MKLSGSCRPGPLVSGGTYSDPSDVGDPGHVSGDAGVDAVLALLGALVSPADDAGEEPGALVGGGVRPAAVPLARVLADGAVSSAEHEAGDLIAALALCAVHVRNLHLLQRVRLHSSIQQPAPAAHQGAGGALQQVLREELGPQADGDGIIGEGNRRLEL